MKTRRLMAILAAVGLLGTMGAQAADTPAATSMEQKASAMMVNAADYPLDYCVVSGEKLGDMGKPVAKTYDGREMKFCCGNCVKSFEKNKANYFKKLDDAIVEAQAAAYPLDVCVVSGEKLGSMGDPYNYIYKNQLVRFCCGGCVKTFEADPEKYSAMVAKGSMEAPAKKMDDMHKHHEGHEGHSH